MDVLAVHTKDLFIFVKDSILGILTSLGCVDEVGVFGSVAANRSDEWSDIDIHVACEQPAQTGEAIIAEINARVPIICYRPFSAMKFPNGRYWFRDHSPFHKLDISFYEYADWRKIMDEHRQQGDPVLSPECQGLLERSATSMFSWDYSSKQKALFDIVHRVHRYTRAYVRRGTDFQNLSRELAGAEQYMVTHPPENKYEEQAWEVAERIIVLVKTTNDALEQALDESSLV